MLKVSRNEREGTIDFLRLRISSQLLTLDDYIAQNFTMEGSKDCSRRIVKERKVENGTSKAGKRIP